MGVFQDALHQLVSDAERELGTRVRIEWTYDAAATEPERWSVVVRPVSQKPQGTWTAATGIAAMQLAAAHFAR